MTQIVNTKFEIGDKLFAFVEGNVVKVSISRIKVYLFVDSYYCEYVTNPVTINNKFLHEITIPEERLYLTSADCRKFETCVYCEIYKSISIKEYKGEYFFNFNKQTFEGFTSIEEAKEYIDILTTSEEKTRMERLDNAIKQVTKNKETASKFLYEAGITNKDGTLKEFLR